MCCSPGRPAVGATNYWSRRSCVSGTSHTRCVTLGASLTVCVTLGASHTGCVTHWGASHTGVRLTLGASHTGCVTHWVCHTLGASHSGCVSHCVCYTGCVTHWVCHTGCITLRLGAHSQRRDNQRRNCRVAALRQHLHRLNRSQCGQKTQQQPSYKPNGATQQHDATARRSSVCLHPGCVRCFSSL